MNLLLPAGFEPTSADTLALVAAPEPAPPPKDDQGDDYGKSSPIALVVILFLAVATALLIRSMTKRIKKLPPTFENRDRHGRVQEPEPNGSARND